VRYTIVGIMGHAAWRARTCTSRMSMASVYCAVSILDLMSSRSQNGCISYGLQDANTLYNDL